MAYKNRLRIALIVLVVVLLLVFILVVPGWGMPGQSLERQTVPPLIPRGYLPLVLSNYSP